MSKEFRVVDCRTSDIDPAEVLVIAYTAEQAARLAIGEELVRNGGRGHLRVRVYFRTENQTLTMVRLFAKAKDRETGGQNGQKA